MSTMIPQRDLRNHNAQIIERVLRGEAFVVTRAGVPVADIRPHAPSDRPPMFRSSADLGGFLDAGGLDARAWLTDIRSGDASVTDDPIEDGDPWQRGRG